MLFMKKRPDVNQQNTMFVKEEAEIELETGDGVGIVSLELVEDS